MWLERRLELVRAHVIDATLRGEHHRVGVTSRRQIHDRGPLRRAREWPRTRTRPADSSAHRWPTEHVEPRGAGAARSRSANRRHASSRNGGRRLRCRWETGATGSARTSSGTRARMASAASPMASSTCDPMAAASEQDPGSRVRDQHGAGPSRRRGRRRAPSRASGNVATATSWPCARAAAAVRPTEATAGSV